MQLEVANRAGALRTAAVAVGPNAGGRPRRRKNARVGTSSTHRRARLLGLAAGRCYRPVMAGPVMDVFAPVGRAARASRTAGDSRCTWCGRRLPDQDGVGRRRRYCAQSCRQRAYENRHALERGAIPADAVVLTQQERDDLADRLYQVRCAAEDVATALSEAAGPAELAPLVSEMLAAA